MKRKNIFVIAAASLLLMLSIQGCKFVKFDDKALDSSWVVNASDNRSEEKEGKDGALRGNISGKGAKVCRSFDLDQCKTLTVNGAGDIDIRHGNNASIVIEVYENLEEYLKVEEDGDGNVTVGLDGFKRFNNAELEIAVTVPLIEKLELNGAGDISIKDMALMDFYAEVNGAGDIELENVNAGDLEIVLNGAGDIESELLSCTSIKVRISGAGLIELSGRAGKADLTIEGAGSIDIKGLECEDTKVNKDGLVGVRK